MLLYTVLQVSGQLPTVPITTPGDPTTTIVPPPEDECVPNVTIAVDEDALLNQLNSGQLAIEDVDNATTPPVPVDCEKNGPLTIMRVLINKA